MCLSVAGCGGKAPGVSILDEETDFSGAYRVEGPDYAGSLTITRAGEGYHLQWLTDDSARYYGKGLAVNGVLGVSYSAGAGDVVQIMAYKKSGQLLSGLGTVPFSRELRTEKTADAVTITSETSYDPSGHYVDKGVNLTGEKYKGKLEIVKSGDVLEAQWHMGKFYAGTGLIVDNVAIFGFTDEGYGVGLAVYVIGEDRLDGVWTFSDYDQLKSESEPILVGTEQAVAD
ncbi:MAG: hypothetical protein JW724_08265 [Candidatus Altiarchaeota archaeon]|nr:hypothetical protein [Candidatus Altiarchaeota archaeon]